MASGQRAVLVSLALCRGPDHRGGDQRAGLPGDRPLRQADAQAERRAAAPGVPWKYGFKSIKSIVQLHLHRQAAGQLLGGDPGRASTASGPTSTREVPHPRWSQATERAARHRRARCRRSSTTATANSSPTSTRAWRASGCMCSGRNSWATAGTYKTRHPRLGRRLTPHRGSNPATPCRTSSRQARIASEWETIASASRAASA